MSIIFDKAQENIFKNNEEACILREIFNIIELKKEKKEINNSKSKELLENYKIKNIKLENVSNDLNKHPKNKFKSKLQKILLKKSL